LYSAPKSLRQSPSGRLCENASLTVIGYNNKLSLPAAVRARAITAAGISVSKKPPGLFPNDVRRPDGITLVPWQAGKAVAWDVTVASTLADSYVGASSTSSAAAAEQAAYMKSVKNADLPASFQFQPIAVETLGPINYFATDFLDKLGQMISAKTNEVRERMYLYQRISTPCFCTIHFPAATIRTSDLLSRQF